MPENGRPPAAKDAGPAVVTLLLRAGANVGHWQEPSNDQAPPGDDRPDPTPAITVEELDAFHEALEGLATAGEQ